MYDEATRSLWVRDSDALKIVQAHLLKQPREERGLATQLPELIVSAPSVGRFLKDRIRFVFKVAGVLLKLTRNTP